MLCLVAAPLAPQYISTVDTIRIAERLSAGAVFTDWPPVWGQEPKRLAAKRADHLKDEFATKQDLTLVRRDLEVLRMELKAECQSGLARGRNQLLTAQVAAFFGIILYIAFRL